MLIEEPWCDAVLIISEREGSFKGTEIKFQDVKLLRFLLSHLTYTASL